jgi:hypothetical protein
MVVATTTAFRFNMLIEDYLFSFKSSALPSLRISILT